MTDFDALWGDLAGVGRSRASGGYRRFAWTPVDGQLREWFAAAARDRGLDVTEDRCGNQWAWWGDPDATPGVVAGSHLDSVPDGGAFDGPLGVVSALLSVDRLRRDGYRPPRPVGIVNFADEEGARFGVACAGSRLLTGALTADRALSLRDSDGITMAEARTEAGQGIDVGPDAEALARVAAFVELHVEQGRALADVDAPVAIGTSIWAHGRFRAEFVGEANHAGTTRLADRVDPTLDHARFVLAARAAATRHDALATCGKVRVEPNAVNAIPARVTGWVDARGGSPEQVHAVVDDLRSLVQEAGGQFVTESWTDETPFDSSVRGAARAALGPVPELATGAGHDAGILAAAGVPTGMLFVRNPTGVSHSPAEHAERVDCLAGVDALTAVLRALSESPWPVP